MSFKVNLILMDHQLVSEKLVAKAILDIEKEIIKKVLPEQFKHGHNLPNPHGSLMFEFTAPHPSGFQFLFFDSFEDKYTLLVELEELTRLISEKIKDVPFFHFKYSSVVDTGSVEVFENGKSIDFSPSSMGDYGVHIHSVMNKYFPIKKDMVDTMRNWFEKVQRNSDFHIFGHFYREYVMNSEDDFMKSIVEIEQKSLELFKNNPRITEKEWLKNKYPYNYHSSRSLYMSYVYSKNKAFASNMYLLTNGNAYEKPGALLLEEPVVITPYDYHEYKKEVREAYEKRRNEVYGEAPPSYKLTAEELERLSYEDQKQEAFNRYEIAKKRREPLLENYFVMGIEPQTPFSVCDYVVYKETFMRVKKVLLKIYDNKYYREAIQLIEMGKNEKVYHNHQAWIDELTFIKEEDVPEEHKVPIQLVIK